MIFYEGNPSSNVGDAGLAFSASVASFASGGFWKPSFDNSVSNVKVFGCNPSRWEAWLYTEADFGGSKHRLIQGVTREEMSIALNDAIEIMFEPIQSFRGTTKSHQSGFSKSEASLHCPATGGRGRRLHKIR